MASSATHRWEKELDQLNAKLKKFQNTEVIEREGSKERFIKVLHDVCDVVRREESRHNPNLSAIVDRVQGIIEYGIILGYSDPDWIDYMESFAHHDGSAPLVQDQMKQVIGSGQMDAVLQLLSNFGLGGGAMNLGQLQSGLHRPGPWNKSRQPAKATPLSRFRRRFPMSATSATEQAKMIYEARCEITTDAICTPADMALSDNGSCLAIAAAGGWKNRDPVLTYYVLDDSGEQESKTLDPGLANVGNHLALMEDRKLIFIADNDRVKSFAWDQGETYADAGVHTLRTDKHDGPLLVLPGDKILRAGSGSAAVWNIDQLETHMSTNKRIGGKYNASNSWRDTEGGEGIELSRGTAPHSTTPFHSSTFDVGVWTVHQPTGNILCADSGKMPFRSGCSLVDLEHGGAIVSKYIGHGGDVKKFSTSPGDPNTFLTGASDGCARLYDIRRPLPVLTIEALKQCGPCTAALFVHPNGVPTVFTEGESKSESVKMWDVRARKVVYELSAGNNSVVQLAWDSNRSILYAATDCLRMDRLGYLHDYRPAKIPKFKRTGDSHSESGDEEEGHDGEMEVVENERDNDAEEGWVDDESDDEDGNEDEEDEDEDEDEDDYDDDGVCWPKNAFHSEDFFGRMYDAADHTMIKYAFTKNPDLSIVPESGHSSTNSGFYD